MDDFLCVCDDPHWVVQIHVTTTTDERQLILEDIVGATSGDPLQVGQDHRKILDEYLEAHWNWTEWQLSILCPNCGGGTIIDSEKGWVEVTGKDP